MKNEIEEVNEVNETLRLLASAPVPTKLTERVQSAVNAERRANVIAWPTRWVEQAAAAILCAGVIGGAFWFAPRATQSAPQTAATPVESGFSQAGAMRKPQPEAVKPEPDAKKHKKQQAQKQ